MKHIRYIIGLSSLLALLVFTPAVMAHDEATSSSGNSSSSSSSQQGSDDHPLTEQQKAEIKTRVDKIKTQLNIKLSSVEEKLIKTKCQPAQTTVKSLSDKTFSALPVRTKAYDELSSKLNTLVTKLDAKNVDTTKLKQELSTLQAKITTFQTDATAYKQTLSDARNIDCTTDPAAFKAALQTARTARDKALADATDIRAYVKDTIKPTLQEIRGQLDDKKQSNSSEGNN